MKVSDVTKEDMKMLAQLVNMVQASKYDISGKDVCASADTIRFLQNFAVTVAKSYQQQASSEKSAPAKKSEDAKAPSSPLGDGVKITSFHPGTPPPAKASKGKK